MKHTYGGFDYAKTIRLSRVALIAGVDNEWEKATRAIQRINNECGPLAIVICLMSWIDTLADHAVDGATIGTVGVVLGMNHSTGELKEEGLPPRVDWAKRLIQARIEMDEAAFRACMSEIEGDNADDHERGVHVGAVLEAAALTIRSMPRGYAVMGRDL